MKRPLNKEEKLISEKALEKLQKEEKDVCVLIKIFNFKKDIELPYNFYKKISDFEKAVKEQEALLKEIKIRMQILSSHLTDGVEIKEKKGEKEQDGTEN